MVLHLPLKLVTNCSTVMQKNFVTILKVILSLPQYIFEIY